MVDDTHEKVRVFRYLSWQTGGLQMRLMISSCALLIASQLVGCGSSSTITQPAEVGCSSETPLTKKDFLSPNFELIPLSPYYAVCAKRPDVLRVTFRKGPVGPQHSTVTEITGGQGRLTITVGKLDTEPDTVLKDIPATSPPRRIRIGSRSGRSFILVSDFDKTSSNLVRIEYEEADSSAQADAIRFANTVVACHISTVPSKANR
jgi:hypothetical protein